MFLDDNVPSFQQARKKRQDAGLAPDTEIGVHPIPRILTLEPFAFDTRLGGVVLEGLFLSPHAFYREIISPEILTVIKAKHKNISIKFSDSFTFPSRLLRNNSFSYGSICTCSKP